MSNLAAHPLKSFSLSAFAPVAFAPGACVIVRVCQHKMSITALTYGEFPKKFKEVHCQIIYQQRVILTIQLYCRTFRKNWCKRTDVFKNRECWVRLDGYKNRNRGLRTVKTQATDGENILLRLSINFEEVYCAADTIKATKLNRRNTNRGKEWSPFMVVGWPRPERLNDVRAFRFISARMCHGVITVTLLFTFGVWYSLRILFAFRRNSLFEKHLNRFRMSDAATAPATAPAKPTKKRAGGAAKAKKQSDHPKYSDMIKAAITSLKVCNF